MNEILFSCQEYSYVAPIVVFIGTVAFSASIKLDTGSAITVIPSEIFTGSTKFDGAEFTKVLPTFKNIEIGVTASGESIHGILCKATKIVLGGTELGDFYFFISDNCKHALLGVDFIRSCNIGNNHEGNIYLEFIRENYPPKVYEDTNVCEVSRFYKSLTGFENIEKESNNTDKQISASHNTDQMNAFQSENHSKSDF